MQAALRLREPRDPGCGQCDSRTLANEFRERPVRALQVLAAKRAHEGGEGQRFFAGCCGLARGEKPIQLVLFGWFGEPMKEQAGAADERDLIERNAQRELNEAGQGSRASVFAGEAKKCALDFASVIGHVLRDDEQTCVWVGREPQFAPDGACGEFGDLVGSLMKSSLAC